MITNVLTFLEKAVTAYPNHPALIDEETTLNYSKVYQYARSLGSEIAINAPSKPPQPYFVFIDKTVHTPVSFFAIVYSGNFYVPVDASQPKSKLQALIDFMAPAGILYNTQEDLSELIFTCPVYLKGQYHTDNSNEPLLDEIRNHHIDHAPLYAMFTSGSTGTPKSVLISHRSVINLAFQFTEAFSLNQDMVIGNQAPFDFDVSTKDLYLTIKNAGTLCLIPKKVISFPNKLYDYLNTHRVNTLIWATSVMRTLAVLKAFSKDKPAFLRLVMFSGEIMPLKVLSYWQENIPNCTYVNLYGPTEITCNCTYFKVPESIDHFESLPIGIPFKNTDILLLDEHMLEVKAGELGEICVRGTSLALGYYKDFEQTSKAFIQNPLNTAYKDVIYKTGDYGYLASDGQLMYMGRKDHQIKHLGHRIELSEIERVVNAIDYIDFGACLYHKAKERIYLFYQATEPVDAKLVTDLKKLLPNYMLPKKLIHYTALPLNKNAKIDRKKLESEHMV